MAAIDARTLYYSEDLGKHCRKLEREAKLAIEETGANMLHLAMGFLEFPEAPGGDKLYLAPLLCIPVAMTRTDDGQYSSFFLNSTGEELADNLSLREKLRRDFAFNLPEYDNESGVSVDAYLSEVTEAVRNQPNWCVRRMMTLTLLSFTNMLLVRELQPESWPQDAPLEEHPLVKQVFEGRAKEGPDGGAQYAEEYQIDDHPKRDIPLIYDADSSQHSALIDVLDGQNRVIEGPPGTGKSQTITNLIAAALHAGKKVLFVAEKLAALEVVKSRLTQAGLDPFVLELHSNKANKKRILEDIETRMSLHPPADPGIDEMLGRLEQKRQELRTYADLMNSKFGNSLDITLHQVMWRAERHRLQACGSALPAQKLEFLAAPRTTRTQLADIGDRLRYLANQLQLVGAYGQSHPLWGFFPTELRPEDDLAVQQVLRTFEVRFERFYKTTTDAALLLGGANINMSAESAKQLVEVLANISPADDGEVEFSALPVLFPANDAIGAHSMAVLLDVGRRIAAIKSLESRMQRCLVNPAPAADELIQRARGSILSLATWGFYGTTRARAEEVAAALLLRANRAKAALERLRTVARTAGIPFSGQHAEIQGILAVVRVCATSTKEILDYRNDGLRQPVAVTRLKQNLTELLRIQSEESYLDTLFHLDIVPSDADLAVAVQTLRQGDAWYRVFQGPWRSAVALHRRITKDKGKMATVQRLRELERLSRLRKDRATWVGNPGLQALAGRHFEAEQTPITRLIDSAMWMEVAQVTLESAGLRLSTFDPLTFDRLLIAQLSQSAQGINQAAHELDLAASVVTPLLVDSTAEVLIRLDSTLWSTRIATMEEAAAALTAAAAFMKQHFRPSITADEGLAVLLESAALPGLEASLANDATGRELLGGKFLGRLTNLEPFLAAHTYGSMVRRANLPESIQRILISEHCVSNHEKLRRHTDAINRGWQDVLDFASAMASYGRFEAAVWADPVGLTTSQFARRLFEKTQSAANQVSVLLPWAQYIGARLTALDQGLEGFVAALEVGDIASDKLEHAFKFRFYAGIAKAAFDRTPTLKQFSGERHTATRREYADLDRSIIKLRGLQIARECKRLSRPPQGNNAARVGDKTEMHLLDLLTNQQRPRVPVRQIMKRAGRAIQELKPCFMMGPQAVAQFLDPGHLKFDIVVMDEASQLRPEQAIGAVARGAQLVVVGDPKQLPPTSFFSRMSSIEDDPDGLNQMATTEAESILDVCISHFRPVRTLRWHYRSHHESLIAFSNHHFYRGNLVVFPSPYPKSRALGLSYHYVSDGVYENQMNHAEARRVVDAAVEHILTRPADSLGVVTLNIKQRDLVAELLDERLRNLPKAIQFKESWESAGLGLFVKNLENVQGDERDCILISTTFGKPKDAKVVRQNFGPISREGGWRRLNVLFTRARKSVAVYSSMHPEDIVSDSRTPEGTKALRNYLEFARNGVLRAEMETNLPPESDFEVAVIDVLRNMGYEVTPQLGVAGFRIDIAVKHPGRLSGYLAAIECDGATYHSGVSVRDRDRIRQEILESLGWRGRIWRIWSTDWFRNPHAEAGRLHQFLKILEKQPLPDDFIGADTVDVHNTPTNLAELDTTMSPVGQESLTIEDLIFDNDEDELEIEVGDLVTYFPAGEPENLVQVRLTHNQTNPQMGLIGENTPLGCVLIGATVGEDVVLRVPGVSIRSYVIKSIKRFAQ